MCQQEDPVNLGVALALFLTTLTPTGDRPILRECLLVSVRILLDTGIRQCSGILKAHKHECNNSCPQRIYSLI